MTNNSVPLSNLETVPGDVEEWLELDLAPEERATKSALPTRGGDDFVVPQLRGWLALGKPVIRSLAAPDDPSLASYQYYHILLAASFRPKEGEPFERVWVQVNLAPEAQGEAVAWSMFPRKETTEIDVTRTVGRNAKLGLEWASGGVSSETRKEFKEEEAFLIAYNELCPDPVWEFAKTEHMPIRGINHLHLVVRKTPGAAVTGNVSVTATVEHKRFGLFTYKAKVDDTPSLTFNLE
jgi:hypothetical protein